MKIKTQDIAHSTSRVLLILVLAMLSSCRTANDVTYFQDMYTITQEVMSNKEQLKAQPMDKLKIIVIPEADNLELENMFNIRAQKNGGYLQKDNTLNRILYTVDDEGYIDFPELHQVNVGGMTRLQIQNEIHKRLSDANLLKDFKVICEFSSLDYIVIGDVNEPGRYEIDKDNFSLIDALVKAKDLTLYGQRTNVKVLREVNGTVKVYPIDLTKAKSTMESPAYWIKQNDVIYVEPNQKKQGTSQVNKNTIRSASFILSCSSLLFTVVGLFIKLVK